ncbi:M15 family metallopeptidase domain-containing protein [Streptomyces lancefieldiae]|uniref:Uncharacterized protein n=1 Tax=Streptomyces lancefieldiae TaxID=3075520 RepID=A0ABU3AZL2_9ACTN|nr:hypothetical protein [Streptomyces sp. DSM 40712]MDT0615260.1 hypothetical protein [Streptomyces sp. DSM 40712]
MLSACRPEALVLDVLGLSAGAARVRAGRRDGANVACCGTRPRRVRRLVVVGLIIVIAVNSGWRSPEYQKQPLREAVSEYGAEREAARRVATATTSSHASGDAVDSGDSRATARQSGHGAEYGLCQVYRNEPWHYARRTEALDRGCPRMYADPAQDPRMQQ